MTTQRAQALLASWERNPAIDAAMIRGRVPPSARPKLLRHLIPICLDDAIANPTKYALRIIENYHHNPIFELTPEDRIASGTTPIQPG